jgi:hypothetical protein
MDASFFIYQYNARANATVIFGNANQTIKSELPAQGILRVWFLAVGLHAVAGGAKFWLRHHR